MVYQLVSCLGIAQTVWAPAAETPISDIQRLFEVNTLGTILLFQTLAPLLFKSDKPQFVPMSSIVIADMATEPSKKLA